MEMSLAMIPARARRSKNSRFISLKSRSLDASEAEIFLPGMSSYNFV